jgi:hypothetical protein
MMVIVDNIRFNKALQNIIELVLDKFMIIDFISIYFSGSEKKSACPLHWNIFGADYLKD